MNAHRMSCAVWINSDILKKLNLHNYYHKKQYVLLRDLATLFHVLRKRNNFFRHSVTQNVELSLFVVHAARSRLVTFSSKGQ